MDLPATTPDSLEDAPAFEKVPAGGAANVAAVIVNSTSTRADSPPA